MPSLEDLLVALSFPYAAAVVGLSVALATRAWEKRRGGKNRNAHATWRVWLAPIAVFVLPVSTFFPHPGGPLASIHDWWHSLEAQLHSWPAAHDALHAANYGILALALAGVARVAFALGRMRSFAEALRLSSPQPVDSSNGSSVRRLSLDEPLCFTSGFRKPTVYVSDGLVAALSSRDREAVLAHEAAHVRRCDPATQTLLTLFYAAFPLPGARLLLADWQQAAEKECDEAAAREIGSTTDVAAALVRVAQVAVRKRGSYPCAAAFLSTPDDVTGRVEALLGLSYVADRRNVSLHFSAALIVLFSAGAWIYHAVELFVRH